MRRWFVAPRGRFAPPPLLTFCGGRSLPLVAPLPLGAASVAAALALLAPASGRLTAIFSGLSAPPRSRRAARQPRPAGARRARSARVSLPQPLAFVSSVHAPRALASLRSTAPLVLPSLGLSVAPLPLRLPALLTPRGALAPCRSLGGARSTPPAVSRRQ